MNQADTGSRTEEDLRALYLEQEERLCKQEEQLQKITLLNEALMQENALLKQRLYGKKSEKNKIPSNSLSSTYQKKKTKNPHLSRK